MATREVCIWKAPGRESIHLYYAQALAYLSRLPAGIFPPRGSRQYFRLSRKKGAGWSLGERTRARESSVVNARSVKQYTKFSRFTTWPWRLFQRWLDPSCSHSFLWFSFSLPHTCFNFCPKPKLGANLYFTFLLSMNQAENDLRKFRSLKSFTQFEPLVCSFTIPLFF